MTAADIETELTKISRRRRSAADNERRLAAEQRRLFVEGRRLGLSYYRMAQLSGITQAAVRNAVLRDDASPGGEASS